MINALTEITTAQVQARKFDEAVKTIEKAEMNNQERAELTL
jgi:hypothetical protein